MIDVFGGRYGSCDGLSRRNVLRVGMLGLAGLAMPDLLRARARAAEGLTGTKDTAVIQVFLGGGPSHLETWDPKPDAPKEYRGELGTIETAVPGIRISELLPRQAAAMAHMAIVRSLHHDTQDHFSGMHWMLTGFPTSAPLQRTNERPSLGSVAARLRGSVGPGVPPYVHIPGEGGLPVSYTNASYLGAGYNPFHVEGDPASGAKVKNLDVADGLTLDRIEDRGYLLKQLDRLDRRRDASGMMDGLDRFAAQAYAMVTGPAARRAFDLNAEDPRTRDRYGRTRIGQSCLLARRLVEAGVTFVTVSEGAWDHHANVAGACRAQLPPLDHAVATLVEDLHARGLAERVLVVVLGEFGRTPKLNGNAGRDHWPNSMSVLLAGGGLTMGQAVGSTGRKGEAPADRPLRPEDLLRTVYHVLGIDPLHEFPNDSGRPMPVMNSGGPIAELA